MNSFVLFLFFNFLFLLWANAGGFLLPGNQRYSNSHRSGSVIFYQRPNDPKYLEDLC